MREKIISELKQLATAISSLDQDTSVKELQENAKELYEKLTVLHYVHSGINAMPSKSEQQIQPTITSKSTSDEQTLTASNNQTKEVLQQQTPPVSDNAINDIEVMPTIEDEFMSKPKVDFADMFEAVLPDTDTVKNDKDEVTPDVFESTTVPDVEETKPIEVASLDPKPQSLNDRLNTTIVVGLNDKIGFITHLFDGSSEDFNRVISQLNTIATEAEAKHFINTMIKPEYNHWLGKEEYEARLMSIIENKFN